MPLGEAGLFALNCTFGNTVMMGIPLITATFGQAGLPILITIIALHSMVLLTLATVVAEIGLHRHAPWRRIVVATFTGVLRNPVVATVFVALAWSTIGLPVPEVMNRTLTMLGAATPPVALFCLGGSLAAFRAGQAWGEVAWATVLKLAALPPLVWGACLLLNLVAAGDGRGGDDLRPADRGQCLLCWRGAMRPGRTGRGPRCWCPP